MYTLAEISKIVGAEVQGNSNVSIGGIATLTKANNKQLSYVNSKNILMNYQIHVQGL